jgi:hypothetical protein
LPKKKKKKIVGADRRVPRTLWRRGKIQRGVAALLP